MLPADSSQVERVQQALFAARPDETRVLVEVLEPSKTDWQELLWRELAADDEPSAPRLRAAMALAAYDPPANELPGNAPTESTGNAPAESTKGLWHAHAPFVVDQLLAEARQDPSQYEPLVVALAPVANVLMAPLSAVFRDASREATERELTASILARYARDDPALLAELVADSQGVQFTTLYPVLVERYGEVASNSLERIAREEPPAELPAERRVTLGRRRAAAAAVLVRQGAHEAAFDVLRVADDPEARTQFVHRTRELGISPAELDDCLMRADALRQTKSGPARRSEDGVLYGLLLALGEFDVSQLPKGRRKPLVRQLADWYANDPSSAVHSATGWLLLRWKRDDLVTRVDHTAIADSPDREWFVVEFVPTQGIEAASAVGPAPRPEPPVPFHITFIVIPAGEYMIGSPEDEAGRVAHERVHRVTLTRTFALSDREITWEQFNPFDHGAHHDTWEKQFSRQLAKEDPAFGMSWHEGAAFCRWLTEHAAMAGLEQAYAERRSLDPKEFAADPDPSAGGAPRNWPVDPHKHGFRLPSEAEWEAACRCRTISAYSFGNDRRVLTHYAWYAENVLDEGQDWSYPGRRLRPNACGLFDLHGNLFEWCHDWFANSTQGEADPLGPESGTFRVGRGGGWSNVAAYCRSALRVSYQPTDRFNDLGLRVLLVLHR
jgi:formylglycine-generating enzyme required for sulfatase activity